MTDQLLVHGLYRPVEEDSRVGGDVYEVVVSPYGSRVFIADVQGKGLQAISAAFAVLSAFREAAVAEPTLTTVVDALEEAVLRHNSFAAQTGERERFVTALILGIDGEPEVEAINCGHVAPLLLHEERAEPVLRQEPCVPLGLDALAPRASYGRVVRVPVGRHAPALHGRRHRGARPVRCLLSARRARRGPGRGPPEGRSGHRLRRSAPPYGGNAP